MLFRVSLVDKLTLLWSSSGLVLVKVSVSVKFTTNLAPQNPNIINITQHELKDLIVSVFSPLLGI